MEHILVRIPSIRFPNIPRRCGYENQPTLYPWVAIKLLQSEFHNYQRTGFKLRGIDSSIKYCNVFYQESVHNELDAFWDES